MFDKLLLKLRANQTVPSDGLLIEEVGRHIERWIGPYKVVHHELNSKMVHIDLYCVHPKPWHPFYTLVTSGMAQHAMHPPKGAERCKHAELIIHLPADWPVDRLNDPVVNWPSTAVKMIIRYAHLSKRWVWEGHTISIRELDFPYMPFDSLLLWEPLLVDKEKMGIVLKDGRLVVFFTAVFIYRDEREFAEQHGSEALIQRAKQTGRLDEMFVVNPKRASVLTIP